MRYLALLAVVWMGCSNDAGPIGYYDPQRLLSESRDGKAAAEALQRATHAELGAAEKAQREAASADEIHAADKQAAAERATKLWSAAVEHERERTTGPFFERAMAVVGKLAAERHMTIVMGISGKLPYAVPRADLTADVIAGLDGSPNELTKARDELRAATERVQKLEARAGPAVAAGAGR